ncbi:cytochrome-c peroxidase [Photobacterium lipolyticum]|uniref:Methylamine utilization protein n=1 Tax=Photobacterium lipolyticum TaxID=266810 RepID=A0A2T3MWN9_9GAMM|nr:cytochrome c peroxidase [Photobacterium lipolyticum]PSW04366.1 methylamine utilization protein [Photobacterium lipolyticum]
MNASVLVTLAIVLTAVVSCGDSSSDDDVNVVSAAADTDVSDTTSDIVLPVDDSDSAGDSQPADPPAEPPPRVDQDGLPLPNLSVSFDYEAYLNAQPEHYTSIDSSFGNVTSQDNTPFDNPVDNAGATLGRVLFYDVRLSANSTIACASCHTQQFGFSDPATFSTGFNGGKTGRHSMGLSNATFYSPQHFFWDERADTLEDQVLMPIQDPVEMGMNLLDLEVKLAQTSFYPALFTAAFGDEAIISARISKALAQFIRSMVSYQSKYDVAFAQGTGNDPDFTGVFTEQEQLGHQLFSGFPGDIRDSLGCITCHQTSAHTADAVHNNGLDANTSADEGAGGGFFKVPSLRNIAVRAPYMHDGRFTNLMEVVEFYNSGVQAHPNLSPALRRNNSPSGSPIRFNLTLQEKEALVAFLNTLTDEVFLANPMFADPFLKAGPTNLQGEE